MALAPFRASGRPFDHITLTTLPPGPGAILMSYAFGERADGGTHFEVRFAKPKPKDLRFYEHVWPNVQGKFSGEFEILRALLAEQAKAAAAAASRLCSSCASGS